jgi:hypothetical protein
MAFVPLDLPPGIYRNNTQYESKGRWFDSNLVRFYENTIRPWGGWRVKSLSSVTGVGRAAHAWKDNNGLSHLAIGCENRLYVMARDGTLTNITPVGLKAGYAIATTGGGYGTGTYGTGIYGTPRPDSTLTLDPTVWSLDNRGENLVATCWTDGKIYEWAPGDPLAAQVTNSPEDCRALVMTPERFLMALGAGNDPRMVAWCDQEDDTVWTASETNQAGSFPLQTGGRLMLGRAARDYTLLITDIDAWAANYEGFPLVYGFTKVGAGCGAISQNSGVTLDAKTVWMGSNGFFVCNGSYVEPLPCEVQDHVYSNLNRQQQTLITAMVNSDFGEVRWHYPSTGSTEVDSFVVWNYRENHWNIGTLARLSGVDKGIFQYPLAIGTDGNVYEHEVGLNYSGVTPFLRSGPFEIGEGDVLGVVTSLIPDEITDGTVNVSFVTRPYPQGLKSTYGPYVASVKNDLRFTGREIEILYEMGVPNADFRIGKPRLDVKPGSRR